MKFLITNEQEKVLQHAQIPIPTDSLRFTICKSNVKNKIKKYTTIEILPKYICFQYNQYIYITELVEVNVYKLIHALNI